MREIAIITLLIACGFLLMFIVMNDAQCKQDASIERASWQCIERTVDTGVCTKQVRREK